MAIQAELYGVVKSSPWLISMARRITGRRVHNSKPFINAVRQKRGLEIGGPSAPFGDAGILPLYRHVGSLDNAVYSASTPFSNDPSGNSYQFHTRKAVGRNFILESSALTDLQDGAYDFVLSSHCLEHCANPIKALREWKRVVRPGGAIIIILPHYRYTFDHRRPLTTLEHMLEDWRNGVGEDDRTHIEEMSSLLDFSRTRGTPETLLPQLADNFNSRCVHHHVFDEANSRALLEQSGLEVLSLEFVRPFNIVSLCTFSKD